MAITAILAALGPVLAKGIGSMLNKDQTSSGQLDLASMLKPVGQDTIQGIGDPTLGQTMPGQPDIQQLVQQILRGQA